jgi:DNA-binding NarL/FixJ family response regulator
MIKKLKILLAEDHLTVREGIKLLVNAQPDMEVVGEAPDGEIAIRMAQELAPDLVIMDISMPNLNGLRATKRLRAVSHSRFSLLPDTPMTAISSNSSAPVRTAMF